MPNQEIFVDVPLFNEQEETEQPQPKLVAFGRYVKTEQYDLFGDYNLDDLTDEQKQWMNAGKLQGIIFNPPNDAPLVVDKIALNPYEYNLVVRSPYHLGKFATARSLNDKDLSDEVVSTGKRAAEHAFEQKQEGMTDHLDKLKDRRFDIRELKKEIKTPGFAHKSPERMQHLAGVVWGEFITILDVAHVQRGWDDNTRKEAQAALINYLTTGNQRDRISKWYQMTELAENYISGRIVLFSNRIKAVKRELDK